MFFSLGFTSVFFASKNNTKCANSITCINNLEAEVNNNSEAIFLGNNIPVPQIDLAIESNYPVVLGDETNPEEKHIYVDLSKQKLYAYQGNELYFETLVSTGKWGRTPTGEFKIWIKVRAQKMSGGSGNDYYYLPNVPYVMFFHNSEVAKSRGFSLHGTYWHNNFGHEMSHGCVNLRTIDAKKIYEWVTPVTTAATTYATTKDPGTTVTICQKLEITQGTTPVCLE